MVTINAADRPINKPGVTDPLPLTAPLLDALDGEIRDVLKPNRMITPDDVRGNAKTLREAVTTKGWPPWKALAENLLRARHAIGRVRPLPRRASFVEGPPIFGWYDTDQPEACGRDRRRSRTDGAKIKEWVKQGFIVRTRSDADTREARDNDHTRSKPRSTAAHRRCRPITIPVRRRGRGTRALP